MGELDINFRTLLRTMPQPILRLAFPDVRLEPVGPVDPSVDRARQRTADSMFRVTDGSTEIIIHVEIEREWRIELPARLFEYASGAASTKRQPIASVVLLFRPGGHPPDGVGTYRIPGIDDDTFVFRYHVVPLWQLDAREMLDELGIRAAPFVAAMRGADEAFVVGLAEEVLRSRELDEESRTSTVNLLFVASAAILGDEAARRIAMMDSLIQDPNVQRFLRSLGDKGREEGRVEGRAEGVRSMLLRVLVTRGFAITPDVQARIDSTAEVSQLEAWHDAAVTAESIGDVFR